GKLASVTGDNCMTHHVVYSDVDFNRHVNSARYVEWMMDALPTEWVQTHDVTHFEVNYLQEALLGQDVHVRFESGTGQMLSVVQDEAGRDLCRMKLIGVQ
ncbi:MAG: acyl-ACP thioesterase, partial [Paludibacteraceae bacterium]|nr:acyl-ACP thioesterase [Paludibacteraceae bacterium]